MMAHAPKHGHEGGTHAGESYPAHFFREFYTVILFVVFFIVMMALPIVLSGFLTATDTSRVVTSTIVSPLHAAFVVLSFLIGLALIFTAPRLIGLYLLAVAAFALVVAEGFGAWAWGHSIAVAFFGSSIFLMTMILRKK